MNPEVKAMIAIAQMNAWLIVSACIGAFSDRVGWGMFAWMMAFGQLGVAIGYFVSASTERLKRST